MITNSLSNYNLQFHNYQIYHNQRHCAVIRVKNQLYKPMFIIFQFPKLPYHFLVPYIKSFSHISSTNDNSTRQTMYFPNSSSPRLLRFQETSNFRCCSVSNFETNGNIPERARDCRRYLENTAAAWQRGVCSAEELFQVRLPPRTGIGYTRGMSRGTGHRRQTGETAGYSIPFAQREKTLGASRFVQETGRRAYREAQTRIDPPIAARLCPVPTAEHSAPDLLPE